MCIVDLRADARRSQCRPLFARELNGTLPVTWTHARAVQYLPPRHSDPFDRMLIAQARCENLSLVSVDSKLHGYDVALINR